jgi:NAD(P) transhydrogenase subunit alpha
VNLNTLKASYPKRKAEEMRIFCKRPNRLPWAAACTTLILLASAVSAGAQEAASHGNEGQPTDYWPMVFVFMLSTFIGVGVVSRVSRLLHTPLMSITNAISAIAVVGSIIVTGSDNPLPIRIMGAIALFASMTNIVSGFMITHRMLKMFKGEKETK